MRPMLAEPATKTQATKNIALAIWWLQQKLDGDRILVKVHNGVVSFLNRSGDPRQKAIPLAVQQFFTIPDGTWYFDGELIDNELWLFDLVVEGVVDRNEPYHLRYDMLTRLFNMPGWDSDGVRLLPTARTAEEKMALTQAVAEAGGEGWMLRHSESVYEPGPGRSSKLLKIKRTHTIDCIVGDSMMDGKENAELRLHDPSRPYDLDDKKSCPPVGRTSLLGKPDVKKGDVVEMRCLYVGANGRLYQPTLLCVRDDKPAVECTIDQLEPLRVNKSVIIPPALATA